MKDFEKVGMYNLFIFYVRSVGIVDSFEIGNFS